MSDFSWFALNTKPGSEKAVAFALRQKGYEEFVPLCREERRWSDRFKEVELALFPGYLFCRFGSEDRLRVLTTPAVTSIVGFGNTPAPVADQQILAIQAMIRSGLPLEPWHFLELGQPVRIERGPLRGLQGVLVQVKDLCRVVLSVTLLRRSVAVEIDRDMIHSA